MQCWETLSSSSDCDEDCDLDTAWPFAQLRRLVGSGHAPPHGRCPNTASSEHPSSADHAMGSLRRSVAMENSSARASLAQWSAADAQRLQHAATWMTKHCLDTLVYSADVAFEAVETLWVAVTIDAASHWDGGSHLDRVLEHWAVCGGMQHVRCDDGTLLRLLCAVCVAQASRRYAPRDSNQIGVHALGEATGFKLQVLGRIDGALFTAKANHCQACTNMATLLGDWVDVVVTRCAGRHSEHGDLLSRCIHMAVECTLEIDSDLILFTPPSLVSAAIVHVVSNDATGVIKRVLELRQAQMEDYRSVLKVVDARYKLRNLRETMCHTPPPPACPSPRSGKRRRLELCA